MVTAINGNFRLMGVIGDPIKQARTPDNINPIFAARGAAMVCIPLNIPAAHLATAWAGLKAMKNLAGFGVTLPHKQSALALCDSLDPLAERVGAVNVVRREAGGGFRGYQFDGLGFVNGLRTEGHDPAGREALMVGAGGAAMAIAFALVEAGVTRLSIANRTMEKARDIADQVNRVTGSEIVVAERAEPKPGQLLVNATSLGLNPDDALPFDPALIDDTMTVAEVIAKPEETRLLALARDRGANVHSGIHMIRGQAQLIADHLIAAGS